MYATLMEKYPELGQQLMDAMSAGTTSAPDAAPA